MNIDLKKTLSSKTIDVPPSMRFTYPTRLANAGTASIMQIYMPGHKVNKPELKISIRPDSTQSLEIKPKKKYHPKRLYKILYKKITPLIQMEDEYIFDARYDVDGNMAHILTNVVPALLAAKEIVPQITVILRSKACSMAINAYKLLGFDVLCTDRDVQGNLILATCPKGNMYAGWYSCIFGKLTLESINKPTPERVFLSRKGSRSIINEHEVEGLLKEYGFEKVYYEDLPIIEQWSIAKNATVVVGIHGAALASLVFNRNSVKLVELFHPGYVTGKYRLTTSAIGGKWCGVTGQIPEKENIVRELDYKQNFRRLALSPTRIDINSLRMALEYLKVE